MSWRFGSMPTSAIACSAPLSDVRVDLIADLALRQNRFLFLELRGGIVAAFDVGTAEAGELNRLAARGQRGGLAVRCLRGNLDRRPEHSRVNHLRRHRALPDQLVNPLLVDVEHAFELARRQIEVRRPDRLVRFLGVLDARLIAPRPVVVLRPEHVADDTRRFLQRLVRQGRGVGAVIANQPALAIHGIHALKQPLRNLHRAFGGKPQLAACLLRQRGRRERRRRPLDAGFLLDGRHRPRNVRPHRIEQGPRGRFVEQPRVGVLQRAGLRIEILAAGNALVADFDQRGDEFAAFTLERGFEVPVDRRAERAAFFLALDDQPNGHALHAPGAQTRLHLLPQHGRQRVAVQAVEDAPALLRANEVLVHVARVCERLLHGFFGDFVEDDAADRNLRLQHLREVPTDRLALAVRVRRQQQLRRFLDGDFQVRHLFLLVAGNDVVGREVLIDIDAEPSPVLLLYFLGDFGGRLRQITNMPEARLDPVLVAEEAAERLRLRGRLDDDERFSHYDAESPSKRIHTNTTLLAHETPASDAADETRAIRDRQDAATAAVHRGRMRPRAHPDRRHMPHPSAAALDPRNLLIRCHLLPRLRRSARPGQDRARPRYRRHTRQSLLRRGCSAWPPLFRPLSTFPGTAMTSRPCSAAQPAVISEPDLSDASITTTARDSPLISRLRIGK